MKKCLAVLLVLFVMGSIFAAGGSEDGKVSLKFGGVTPEPAMKAAEKFKEIAEAADPSLEIVIYHSNVLGDDRVQIESTRLGDIDICVTSTSPIANTFPNFYLFDAPYLFLSAEEVDTVVDGPIGKAILAELTELNLKGLEMWENGFRNLTSNENAVLPADVAGLKIRTMENDVHLAAWKAIGANPTPMAFSELFTALQQGTIDAQENPFPQIDVSKFYEVQDYITVTEHVWTPFLLVMNMDKFDSLTESQQNAILKAARESTIYQREQSRAAVAAIRDNYIANDLATIIDLTPEQKQAWQQKVIDGEVFELVKAKMDNPEYLDQIINK